MLSPISTTEFCNLNAVLTHSPSFCSPEAMSNTKKFSFSNLLLIVVNLRLPFTNFLGDKLIMNEFLSLF